MATPVSSDAVEREELPAWEVPKAIDGKQI